MGAGHRTSTGRRGPVASHGGMRPATGPDEGTAHRPTPDGSGIAEPTCTRGYRNRSDRTPRIRCDQGQLETAPDTSRHPSRTPRNVSTSGRVVQTSKQVTRLALGKTSARYGDRVPTPRYGQPRYRFIASELRERIEGGTIPPGSLLPTESALTAEYRASRGTIRQAIAALRDEGLVVTEHGRGTYVRACLHEGRSPSNTEVESRQRVVAASAEIARLFGVDVNTPLLEDEEIARRSGAVESVTKIYHLPE
ncbi:GntR family transcriptional regulator [Micromonospora profundi]|uniref:GntR family transcriptional regulator n=1 Tax=Micromonospora profundi TaxID=1420889 RepID=UPI003815A1E1